MLPVVCLIAVVAACGGPVYDVESRVVYWGQEIAETIPPGTPLDRALELATDLDAEASYSGEEEAVILTLERIEDTGVVCAEWLITAQLSVKAERIQAAKVESQGLCL